MIVWMIHNVFHTYIMVAFCMSFYEHLPQSPFFFQILFSSGSRYS